MAVRSFEACNQSAIWFAETFQAESTIQCLWWTGSAEPRPFANETVIGEIQFSLGYRVRERHPLLQQQQVWVGHPLLNEQLWRRWWCGSRRCTTFIDSSVGSLRRGSCCPSRFCDCSQWHSTQSGISSWEVDTAQYRRCNSSDCCGALWRQTSGCVAWASLASHHCSEIASSEGTD